MKYKQTFLRHRLLSAILLISINHTYSSYYYFYVQFKDKANTPYSLSNPLAYLSERAIARRATFNIAVDSTDLPVNPSYVQAVQNIGIQVHNRSKWMNGVTVLLSDSSQMRFVRAFPFVKFVEYTGQTPVLYFGAKKKIKQEAGYGNALNQINQIHCNYLHNQGFRGSGVMIGVIDDGFQNVDINPCFDSLRQQNRLLGTKDIVNSQSNIYNEDDHGALVLSTMAGILKNPDYLGTAPDASYWLIRSEVDGSEYKVETDFWCSGIEFADSIGVDIVNSSLGYFQFDDASMDYTYSDMNGKTVRSSRAAELASKKGIIAVISAGNEGSTSWHYIGSPADAQGIITVGGVDSNGNVSSFSSYGPTSDNRTKPELCATGSSSAIVGVTGSPVYGYGTSFASPILAGTMACYLQALKKKNYPFSDIPTLLKSVIETGDTYLQPLAHRGYGIPNFEMALNTITSSALFSTVYRNNLFSIKYSTKDKSLDITLPYKHPDTMELCILSILGKEVLHQIISDSYVKISTENLIPGLYLVRVKSGDKSQTIKIII